MMGFYELDRPREERVAPNDGKWFVTISKTTGCLLNDGSAVEEISVPGQDNTRFYFNTILGAHLNASLYYKLHGLVYPYQDEWEAAILNDVGKTLPTNDSRTMEFI